MDESDNCKDDDVENCDCFLPRTINLSGISNNRYYSIAYKHYRTLPPMNMKSYKEIEVLDISHNCINNLDLLSNFINLNSLIADHNQISDTTLFPYLPKLKLLWLNRCKINSLYPFLKQLNVACPNIEYLSLMDNAATPSYFNGGTFFEYLQYRLYILSIFPDLKHLDDRKVTNYERYESKRLYRQPFIERLKNFNNKNWQSLRIFGSQSSSSNADRNINLCI